MAASVEGTVSSLRAAYNSGKSTRVAWRVEQLRAVRQLMCDKEAELVAAAGADMGRPMFETVNVECSPIIAECDLLLDELPRFVKGHNVDQPLAMGLVGAKSFVKPMPKGVVLIIGAWNFPFNLTLGPMLNAIAAGNCVLIKPSEHAPVCAKLVETLISHYLCQDCIRVVQGDAAVSQELLRHRFDHILYTGSERVGRIVYAAAAAQLTPCTLELGGKNMVYVHHDAHLSMTARRICQGAFANSGQFCLGLDVVLVHHKVLKPLLAELKKTVLSWYGSAPLSSNSFGRMQSEAAARRIEALLKSHGGETLCGGEVHVESRYVAPTIVLDPALDSQLMRDELFAPVVAVKSVDCMEEAIALQAARPTPLCKYVFAQSRAVADEYMSRVRGGMGCINDILMQAANPNLPFGGCGNSGIGAYHGTRGLQEMSHMCGILRQQSSPLFDLPFRYPPYTATNVKTVAFLVGFRLPRWLNWITRIIRPTLFLGALRLAYEFGKLHATPS